MLRGASYLERAQSSLHDAAQRGSARETMARTRADVTRARDEFDSASNKLAPFSFVLPHLSWVPRIGDQLAAAASLASAGKDTSNGIVSLLAGLDPLVRAFPDGTAHARVPTVTLLARLAAGHADFHSACGQFHSAADSRASIGAVDSPALVSALQTFDDRLPGLRVICRFLQLAPVMLGYPRPRTYLIAYQDPLELRATGGFLGSAGIITIHNGATHQDFKDSSFRGENETVPAPEPIHLYNTEPFWLFRDSNWSPDFPTTAALERYFLRLDLHQDVSGVINLTPIAAAALISATGPVHLPEYSVTVTDSNVAQLADYYAHWSTQSNPNQQGSRKQFIQILGAHLFSRLERLSPASWVRLGEALAQIGPSGAILLNSLVPAEEAAIQAAGAGGEISRKLGDYLYIVDSNLSYNKINPYIREKVSYSAHVRPDGWIASTLTLHYRNVTPASLAVHGIGPGAGELGGHIDYADFIRVYVPDGAELVDQRGWTQPWSPGPAYGRTMFSGYLIVPVNRSRTVRLEYVTPPNALAWSGGSRYRLLVQYQPGSNPLLWRLSVAGAVSSPVARSILAPDRNHTLDAPLRLRAIQPIPLPKQPPTVVAPNHWIEPHAFLAGP